MTKECFMCNGKTELEKFYIALKDDENDLRALCGSCFTKLLNIKKVKIYTMDKTCKTVVWLKDKPEKQKTRERPKEVIRKKGTNLDSFT
jgi:hypothetical protein